MSDQDVARWLGRPDGLTERRAKQAHEAQMKMLEELLPKGAFAPWMTEHEIRVAAVRAPDDGLMRMVFDTIRKRHLAALTELAEWEPGVTTDALVQIAGQVKELVRLSHTLREIVEQAGKAEG